MSALDDVLDAMARAAGTPHVSPLRIGSIVLTEDQAAAVHLIRRAMTEFGGALLADTPGSGKTFVALAVAAGYDRCVVTAPASLRGMWRDACERAAARATFVSLEHLSRGRAGARAPHLHRAPLLIVDEAHRAANPRANRYARIAALAHGAHVLLLTATPVRNGTAERDALLGLFLGHQARDLDGATLARCLVRRTRTAESAVPRIMHHEPFTARADRRIAGMLRALPPPIALADGDPASGLVASGLARAWASGLAALDRMLVRRLQRGAALASALDAGRLPTRDEMRTWVIGDDAMQLALPLVAAETGCPTALSRDALERHVAAVAALRGHVAPAVLTDTRRRTAHLMDICKRHPDAMVVAFTCFEATARACFSAMRQQPGVVLLTGQRCESGAGSLSRADVLAALGPTHHDVTPAAPPVRHARMRMRLVIATDLMSEGVNLQGASVIVHLDDPWTPSAIEQRVGRAARMGSAHGAVHVYRFRAPSGVEHLTQLGRLHTAKRRAADRGLRPSELAHQLRQGIAGARRHAMDADPLAIRTRAVVAAVAACSATAAGCVAVMRDPAREWLVAGRPRASGAWRIVDDQQLVLRLITAARWTELEAPTRWEMARMTQALARWAAARTARARSGLDRMPSAAARQLINRLDRTVAEARNAERPTIAAHVGRVRALVASARGAGIERALGTLLEIPDGPDWLDRVARMLEDAPNAAPQGPIEIVAILVLRAAESPSAAESPGAAESPSAAPGPPFATCASAPARRPSRRAASTGTAAPR